MKKIFTLLVFLCLFFVYAEKTPISSLYEYTLDNGLKVFVSEDHTVPLTYIEIAVRCGAFTQDKDTAGLFHLYEHIMFKGNKLYPTASSVTNALSSMGVSSWNGSTDLECVNYYFTVPSSLTEKGLEFWSEAIRSPLMDEKELENEKKVVLSEITGDTSEPGHILYRNRIKALFPDSPWKVDPSGNPISVASCTVSKLKEIQKKFYIPNNSALFIGGDVKPDEVYKMVKEIYGSWKAGEDPFKNEIKHPENPLNNVTFCVYPYDKISPQICEVSFCFRGPDALYNQKDTYTCDILLSEVSNPSSLYKRRLMDKGLLIPDSSYIFTSYPTRRLSSLFTLGAIFTNPEISLTERVEAFRTSFYDYLIEDIDNMEESTLKDITQRLLDSNIYERETYSSILSSLKHWWVCTSSDYYYDYDKNMALVTKGDIKDFLKTYIRDRNSLVTVLINPEVYAVLKEDFMKAGYKEFSEETSFIYQEEN